MPIDEIIEVLTNEAKCVEWANTCGRQCNHCDLVMPDKKILGAYAAAIKLLSESKMRFSSVPDEDDGK